MASRTSAARTFAGPKVPEVFVLFWVVKLLTTGIGESTSDALGNWNIPVAAVIGIGGFAAALWWQTRATAYHPVRYWVTVLMVAVFGTMISDGPHIALGSPYWLNTVLYLAVVLTILFCWHRSEGTLSVHSITTSRRERFYWGTVLCTFGLGTAAGDWTATSLHLGYVWSIVVFGVAILIPLALWRAGANATFCFWFAYVLTRPLGASVADYLEVDKHDGGAGLGAATVAGLGLLVFACFVVYLARTHRDREGHHASAAREREHERRADATRGLADLDVTAE